MCPPFFRIHARDREPAGEPVDDPTARGPMDRGLEPDADSDAAPDEGMSDGRDRHVWTAPPARLRAHPRDPQSSFPECIREGPADLLDGRGGKPDPQAGHDRGPSALAGPPAPFRGIRPADPLLHLGRAPDPRGLRQGRGLAAGHEPRAARARKSYSMYRKASAGGILDARTAGLAVAATVAPRAMAVITARVSHGS